jgi:transposase
MARQKLLSERQWEKIAPLLPRQRSRGRPWANNRKVLEGILWILRTGARWVDLPEEYASPSTCWRRLKLWEEQGVWLKIWRSFLTELNERGRIHWSECFMDATFAPAKKGGSTSERPERAKAQSSWYWQTARVFLWEFPSIALARVRPSLRRRRSRRSE